MIKTVIWDWNGTLLDDLDLSLNSVNILLKERNLPLLTEEKYKNIFTFPVIEYYKAAGFDFDKEPFEVPAKQYVRIYRDGVSDVRLFPDVVDTLTYLKEQGYRLIVLSAMRDDNLKLMIEYAGISHFFDGIFGIKDNYAREKISLGKQLVNDLDLNPTECLMIGDTLHDAEVSEHCGFNCILYTGGHVSRERLETKNLRIIDRLEELKTIL